MTTEVSSRTIWRERGPLPNDWIAAYSMRDESLVYLKAHTNLSAKALRDLRSWVKRCTKKGRY